MLRYGRSYEACMKAVGRLLDVGDIPSRLRGPMELLTKMFCDPANHVELAGLAQEVEEACTELLEHVEDLHDLLYRAVDRAKAQPEQPEPAVAAVGGAR